MVGGMLVRMRSNTRSTTGTTKPRSKLAADVLAAAATLRGLVGELDPKDVPLSWAPEVMAAFATVERYGAAGRMLMTARAAQAGQWERERYASPAEWLAAQQGTTSGRARADLETSERLEGLDATSGAVREGRLSPEQAGAVADAAAVNPDAENDLLEHAERESLRRTREEAERRKAEARSEEERPRVMRGFGSSVICGSGIATAQGAVSSPVPSPMSEHSRTGSTATSTGSSERTATLPNGRRVATVRSMPSPASPRATPLVGGRVRRAVRRSPA